MCVSTFHLGDDSLNEWELTMEGTTKKLAQLLVSSAFADLDDDVRHEGKRAFLNWLGCTLGGSRHEAVNTAVSAVMEFAGPPQASVIGRDLRTDMVNAAFINCMSSSAYAFDDTHLLSITHPTGPIAASLMALCEEHHVGGKEFLNALVLGIETECRLSNALVVPPARCHLGFYMTGLTGGVGAAAAVGKILGLDVQHMTWAIGIAAVQGDGFRDTHATMCSSFVPAQAARNGMIAAMLARKGFTCSDKALEAPNGFADVHAHPANLDVVTEGWGTRYETRATAYKPYPCGIFTHPSIEACLSIVKSRELDASTVDKVVLEVHPLAKTLTARPEPRSALDAQVSVQHWAAVTLLRGKAGLAETSVESVNDPDVMALRKRVEVKVDERLTDDAAVVRVLMKDGTELVERIAHCIGSINRPMSDEQLVEKFLKQCEMVMEPAAAQRLAERCWQIDHLSRIAELLPLIPGYRR
jgi:2-methylcitrate dehydratase PrpD